MGRHAGTIGGRPFMLRGLRIATQGAPGLRSRPPSCRIWVWIQGGQGFAHCRRYRRHVHRRGAGRGRAAHAQGADHAAAARGGGARRRAADPGRCRAGLRRHRRCSCTARRSPPTRSSSARRAHRADRHRGLPRRARYRRTRAATTSTTSPSRSRSRWCRARCASPCPSASTCTARCALPLDEKAVRAGARRRSRRGHRASPSPSCTPTSTRARAARRATSSTRSCRPWVTLCRARSARDPRIRAHLDGGRQRLCPAADGPAISAHATRRCAVEQFRGAIYLVTSGGGLTAIETARRFPVRLVESGARPAARSSRRRSRRACGEARCCRSTWAAPRPRSA